MKILLVCNAGMSTGIMRIKLEEEAQRRGIEATVVAVPMVEIDDHADTTDVALLGPQIRFAVDQVKKTMPSTVPVMAIAPQDFGTMNAKKVLDEVLAQLS